MAEKSLLRELPSVDEALKSPYGEGWLKLYPRRYVLDAIRQTIERNRVMIMKGDADKAASIEEIAPEIDAVIKHFSALSLRPVINATGVVVHTNLGRSPLSESALKNIIDAARGYSNLEYDLREGKRGKRYSHIKRLLRDMTGAEDGLAVNNNAGAVLLALNTLAKGKEVIVSRGELVEIGGSFRIPDVMAASGALLKEVGATNKTHLGDYRKAIRENTALILKVHQSNYRISGFTSEVPIEDLITLGNKVNVPVMYDLGSGCLIDLSPYGVPSEPTVQSIVGKGPDIVTFSGDKLLGGPQAGIIVGRKVYTEEIQKNPLTRALRIDKLTLAALEATLMEYADPERAKEAIPTLRMLLEVPASIKRRAKRLQNLLAKDIKNADISIVEDTSYSGGGALPGTELRTYAVSLRPDGISVNLLEERLRKGSPPVVARIKEGALIVDLRTVQNGEVKTLAGCLKAAIGQQINAEFI